MLKNAKVQRPLGMFADLVFSGKTAKEAAIQCGCPPKYDDHAAFPPRWGHIRADWESAEKVKWWGDTSRYYMYGEV